MVAIVEVLLSADGLRRLLLDVDVEVEVVVAMESSMLAMA
jgi:hypothetical protein